MEGRALVIGFLTAMFLTTWDAKAQVGGSGTPGSIPVWDTETTLRDSNLAQLPGGSVVANCSGVGVCLQGHNSQDGTGVIGFSANGFGIAGDSIVGDGVSGTSTLGTGVYATSDSGNAVSGISSSNSAVLGESNTGRGVEGQSESAGGVVGFSNSSIGVAGNSTSGRGMQGVSSSLGGVVGISDTGDGVAGVSGGSAGIFGLAATGTDRAGLFSGSVAIEGNLLVAGLKLFRMDHPLDPANKYLSHSAIESPDVMNLYNGNITTDGNGNATVVLPDYFTALNKDYRYQLTPIGQFALAMVASEIDDNHFAIKTDKPFVMVSWQVTGIRQDAWAKAHPLQVEEEKPEKERGRYLRPELYDQPEEKGVVWLDRPDLLKDLKAVREKQGSKGQKF